MAQLVVTTDAEADLYEILDYLRDEASPAVAAEYGRKFRACIDRLIKFPGIGPRRPALGPDSRVGIVPPRRVAGTREHLPRSSDVAWKSLRAETTSLLQEPIPHRPPAHALGRGEDGVHIEAVVAVQLGKRAGLAEVLNAERPHAVPAHTAKPG
jgi:plasmid stabilization system protein ParE